MRSLRNLVAERRHTRYSCRPTDGSARPPRSWPSSEAMKWLMRVAARGRRGGGQGRGGGRHVQSEAQGPQGGWVERGRGMVAAREAGVRGEAGVRARGSLTLSRLVRRPWAR
jgi:hypothetical protein